jgi:thymidylate synthase
MLPGEIAISINDAHIYKNHIEQTKQQLERVPFKFPLLEINKSIESYEDMCELVYKDFNMKEYYHWPRIKAEMAA